MANTTATIETATIETATIETATIETATIETPKEKKPKLVAILVRFIVGKKIFFTEDINIDMNGNLKNQLKIFGSKNCHILTASKDVTIMVDGKSYPFTKGLEGKDTKILTEQLKEIAKFGLVCYFSENAKLELRNSEVLAMIGAKHPMLREDALSLTGFAGRVIELAVKRHTRADKQLVGEGSLLLLGDAHRKVCIHQEAVDVQTRKEKLALRKQGQIVGGK